MTYGYYIRYSIHSYYNVLPNRKSQNKNYYKYIKEIFIDKHVIRINMNK